ncbi:MAG: hypothetical protein IBJ15_02090 [Alphaproteobacteria bacterium]|nr:hypothetical protein [Alphaproteobacteria bacterium]
MTDIIIEGVRDETIDILRELARAHGVSMEDMAKALLDTAAAKIRGAKD